MSAPVVVSPAGAMPQQPHERAQGPVAGKPLLPASDLLALSLIGGLPRADLYTLLRGAPTALDAKARPEGSDPPLDGTPAQRSTGARLEDLLARLGCPDARALAETGRSAAKRLAPIARAGGIDMVAWGDARYPPLLARIFDPPLVLWVRGSVESLSAPAIAIVGSRASSAYGDEAAMRLASDLAARGLVVVSGLARGIDAAAHRGALAVGAVTVAVLGCGVDVTYPPEHVELKREVARSGAVISELPPGSPPYKANFPRRNRIISGLSNAVIVVEARQRSGALITADCALEQGREVMAVPGNVLSDRHRGSHTLLKAGAALVETAADVLELLKIAPVALPEQRPADEDRLLALMDPGEAYALDTLQAMSGEDVATILPRLLALELHGLVRRAPGGRFVRCRANVLR